MLQGVDTAAGACYLVTGHYQLWAAHSMVHAEFACTTPPTAGGRILVVHCYGAVVILQALTLNGPGCTSRV